MDHQTIAVSSTFGCACASSWSWLAQGARFEKLYDLGFVVLLDVLFCGVEDLATVSSVVRRALLGHVHVIVVGVALENRCVLHGPLGLGIQVDRLGIAMTRCEAFVVEEAVGGG